VSEYPVWYSSELARPFTSRAGDGSERASLAELPAEPASLDTIRVTLLGGN
jgi:hypothetical protein